MKDEDRIDTRRLDAARHWKEPYDADRTEPADEAICVTNNQVVFSAIETRRSSSSGNSSFRLHPFSRFIATLLTLLLLRLDFARPRPFRWWLTLNAWR
jgi:hypothetical protein